MKVVILLIAGLAVASAYPQEQWYNDAPSVSLTEKQVAVLHLLNKPTTPIRSSYTKLKEAAETFKPLEHRDKYTDDGHAAEHLINEIKDHRVTAKNQVFSLFNTRQREEALMLFDVLMHAGCAKTFIQSAAYFREQMNEGEFVYAFYVSVIHSSFFEGVALPPLYEVTPHLFTSSEVIHEAYTAKMKQEAGTFRMNFTGSKKNPEQRVAYFGEDIGMNSHHVSWHMDFPFWWDDKYGHHADRKGELFFYAHHQLTARFDAERLSNHLDVVDELYWDKPIVEGYAPQTTYRHGGEFPSRPDNIHFEDVDGVARVRDMKMMEERIRDAIALGYLTDDHGEKTFLNDEHGIDHLGDVIESSTYSPNPHYYGSLHNLAHIMLGRVADPHGKYNMPPGVMEHFETATRDPAFFRLHKYMDNIFKEHKESLPIYSLEETKFAGVAIDHVDIAGKLETYFEDFEFDLTMAVDDTEKLEDHPLKAVVSRLNHKPFQYKIDVNNNNDADVLATVRIFICPSRTYSGELHTPSTGSWGCIEMDKFWKTLHPGANHVTRKSSESSITIPDRMPFQEMLHKSEEALANGDEVDFHEYLSNCGHPQHMLLPKGTTSGMEFQLLVAVTDGSDGILEDLEHNERGSSHGYCGVRGQNYPDKKPMGYPFDRHIPDSRLRDNIPNFSSTVVHVYHDCGCGM